MKNFWSKFLLILLMVELLYACKPEEFDTDGIKIKEFNPEYAIPLVHSKITVDDVNEDCVDYRVFDKNGFIRHIYLGGFKTETAEEAIKLSDQTFQQTITLTDNQAAALSSGTDQSIFLQSIHNINAGNMEWDSLFLKGGKFTASINSQIKTGGELKITIVDAQKNGNKLVLNIPFSFSSLPVQANASVSMDGFHVDFSNAIKGFNEVNISYELNLKGTSQTITSRESMQVSIDWTELKFKRFFGYAGPMNFSSKEDTMSLCILDSKIIGEYHFDYAFLKIKTSNSFGAPITARFNKLVTFSNQNGERMLTNVPNPLPVRSPDLNQVGQVLTDSATMDRDNSNLKTEINNKPKKLIYQCGVDLNPSGRKTRNNFEDNSCFKLDLVVDLPMEGFGRDFIIDEEEPVSIDVPDDNTVESAMMRIIAINGLPVELSMQVYMVDSFGAIFDSIFVEQDYKLLESAMIDNSGRAVEPIKKTTEIIFPADRAKRLSRLSKVLIRARPNSFNSGGNFPTILLFDTDFLEIYIGVKLNLKIEHEE
ncbi:MAG: hypothetical protein H6605_07955 [Flavobacteriales bacterium]|nr:hypothetical protein [Flavobacteriales bacterium]